MAAILTVIFVSSAVGQVAAIALGGLIGLMVCRDSEAASESMLSFKVPRWIGIISLISFFALLVLLPLAASSELPGISLFDAFYRSGALVFGGGHVVLPLLQAEVVDPGWVSNDAFLAGYGVTQAMPGPLFTFAAYLGAVMGPQPNGAVGAAIALLAVFLPGFLLLLGALPFWDDFRRRPLAQAAMRGANAAVVGILAAALYSPVWTSAIIRPYDFALAAAGFLLLTVWKAPPWIVVITMSIGGIGLVFL